MNSKTWFLLIVAMLCGAAASFCVKSIFFVERDAQSSDETEVAVGPKTQTLVANVDLPVGTELNALNVRLDLIPESRVPRDAILSFDGLSGRKTTTDIKKDAPISLYDLADSETTPEEESSFVPPGYTVVPVEIQAATNAKGGRNYLRSTNLEQMLAPGDRVDLAVVKEDDSVQNAAGGTLAPKTRRLTTQTIVEDVPVFAVADDSQFVEETGETKRTSTLSVLLSAEQLKLVQSASEAGKIKVVEKDGDEAASDDSSNFQPIWGIPGESAVAGGARAAEPSPNAGFDANVATFAIPTNDSFVLDAGFADEPNGAEPNAASGNANGKLNVETPVAAPLEGGNDVEIADANGSSELPIADPSAVDFAIDESVLDANALEEPKLDVSESNAAAKTTVGTAKPVEPSARPAGRAAASETFEENETAVDVGALANATPSTVRVFRPRFPEGADETGDVSESDALDLPADATSVDASPAVEPSEEADAPKAPEVAPSDEADSAKGNVEMKDATAVPAKTFKPYSPFVLKNPAAPKRVAPRAARSRNR